MKQKLISLAVFVLLFNPMMPGFLPAGTDYAFHEQFRLFATPPPIAPAVKSVPDFVKKLNCQDILMDWRGGRADMPGLLPAGPGKICHLPITGIEAKIDTAFARPEKSRPANPYLFIKKIQVYTDSFNSRKNNTTAGPRGEAGITLHPPPRTCMPETPIIMPRRLFQPDRPEAGKNLAEYRFGGGFDLPLKRIHATLSVGMDKRRIHDREESTESFDNLKISWSPNFAVAIHKIRQYLAGFYHGSATPASQERKIRPELILAGVKVKY